MKITNRMIDPELLIRGRFYSLFTNYSSTSNFKRVDWFMDRFYRGRVSKKILCREKYIEKKDASLLRLCIYEPIFKKPAATGLLWIHGGGFAIGVPEQDLSFYEKFIDVANCVIVAPDYTRSVQKPYPAALMDCYETLLWMKAHANELGICPEQLFVGGESAGGGLTAALCLYARDMNEINIAFQIPLYPMLDHRMRTPFAQNNNAPIWNSNNNRLAWRLYLGDELNKKSVSKYAVPALETNYARLPPAFTFVGNIEAFHDETIAYMTNLQKAGVPVNYQVYKGCYHAFDLLCPRTQLAKAATKELQNAFCYAVAHYFT